jgi:hypothetical protein
MKLFSVATHAALAFALLASAAQATTISYDFTMPTFGSGSFSYDDAALSDLGGGSYTSALTAFSFAFNSHTYTLADATSSLAWFADPGQAFVGIQYLGSHATDNIEFAAGFGAGDLGTFTPNNNGNPVSLTDSNFTLQSSGGGGTGLPEPGTLACLLVGVGAARLAGVRKR